ncbi:uncharacterized protein V6R79_016008 [Siganus canaliculatus]
MKRAAVVVVVVVGVLMLELGLQAEAAAWIDADKAVDLDDAKDFIDEHLLQQKQQIFADVWIDADKAVDLDDAKGTKLKTFCEGEEAFRSCLFFTDDLLHKDLWEAGADFADAWVDADKAVDTAKAWVDADEAVDAAKDFIDEHLLQQKQIFADA